MSRTIILKDERCIDHITTLGHPESPQRLKSIYSMLRKTDMKGRFEEIEPRIANKDEISLNHDLKYIDIIESTSGKSLISLDGDTNTSSARSDERTNIPCPCPISRQEMVRCS